MTSMRGEKPSQTNPTPQMGEKKAARGMFLRMNSPSKMPQISKRPPTKLAQQPADQVLNAKFAGVISTPNSGEYLNMTGSITKKTVWKPAGVLTPYGRAVTSRRSPSFAER